MHIGSFGKNSVKIQQVSMSKFIGDI